MNSSLKASVMFGAAILFSPVSPPMDAFEFIMNSSPDEAYLASLNECTTGLALGTATRDGRPLLWKNRDVGNTNQEFHYYDDGRIPFISITYSGETDEYYGGLNAVGFALENSNSYNLRQGPYGGDDDGRIHTLALSTCHTVDDFERLLDSTNEAGRTLNSNYGAIDAFGNAAMFEVGGHEYTRCDAAESPSGFLIRSNYSYSGQGVNARASSWGPHRHDAAYALFASAVEQNNLTAEFVFQRVIRDISVDGLDPYPLPFNGYFENYAFGSIPNGEAICRSTTRGVLVVQGVAANERPDDAILWAMAGSQLTAVATPLWVRAGSVPPEYDSPDGSRINRRAVSLLSYVYNQAGAVNTWRLTNPEHNGLWDYTLPLERWVFSKTDRFVHSPQFSYDKLAAFQNEIAAQVADSLERWKPTLQTTNIVAVEADGGLTLRWPAPNGMPGRDAQAHYRVFSSVTPFRDGDIGTLLGETIATEWCVNDLNPAGGFYRVECYY